jgi:vacuolar protein sorting-associated protein 18
LKLLILETLYCFVSLFTNPTAPFVPPPPLGLVADFRLAFPIIDIEVNRSPGQIRRLFLDPTGNHLIISTLEENLYLHRSWKGTKKPRALSKTKGVFIDSVGWDLENTEVFTTGNILIGGTQGGIYELNVDAHDGGTLGALSLRGLERSFRQLYRLPLPSGGVAPSASSLQSGADAPNAVHGLCWFRFPHQPTKMCILASGATRLYQFVGSNTFELLFQHYNDNPPDFQEFPTLPGAPTVRGELAVYMGPPGDATIRTPKSIAWLTGAGLFMANILLASQNTGEGVLDDSAHLPYPVTETEMPGPGGRPRVVPIVPVSVVLTEFHFMLLYPNGLCLSQSRITNDIVYEGRFPVSTDMFGLAHDPRTAITFAFSQYHVFEVHIRNEDRNVWQAFLQRGLFALAQQYCREAWQRDRVWSTQADHYFAQKQYELAAQYYGKTQKPFEEVTLRFIHMGEHDALRSYLKEKLAHMNARDNMQMTIVCTWLTELYLSKLNKLESEGSRQLESCLDEFRAFLEDYSKLKKLDPATTFNLISSHGRTKELLFYATLIKDYDKVIGYHVQHAEYEKALDVLVQQRDSRLFYKYSPVLMAHCSAKLVTVLMRLDKDVIEPRQLIPALLRYKPTPLPSTPTTNSSADPNQAIRYLQYCVQQLRSKDPAIHNMLLSLYAETENDAALMTFLQQQQKEIYFDLEYALRLCMKHNKQRACVLLYSRMGLFEEAVELALKVDIDLAKQIADMPMPEDDVVSFSSSVTTQNDTRKKLWLRIARHVVEDQKDITKAMEFLKDRNDLLKIEDILPFFPDFVLIDDFKDEICRSLQEYNKHIEDLEHEMAEATKSADAIRQDIEKLKNKYGFVNSNQVCDICKFPILSRAFYLFPCQHVFHRSCLSNEVQKNVDDVKARKISELINTIKKDTLLKRGTDAPVPIPSAVASATNQQNMASPALSSLPSALSGGLANLQQFAAAALNSSSSSSSTSSNQQSLLSDDVGMRTNTSVGLSNAEAQAVHDELDRHIAGECVQCGDVMIRSVSKPFIDLNAGAANLAQLDVIRSWEI